MCLMLYSLPFLINQEKEKGEKNEQNADNSFLKRCQTLRTINLLNFFHIPNADINVHSFHYIGNHVFRENNKQLKVGAHKKNSFVFDKNRPYSLGTYRLCIIIIT